MLTETVLRNEVLKVLGADLSAFGPELLLCVTIVVLLLARFVVPRAHLGLVALIGTLFALLSAAGQWQEGVAGDSAVGREIFGGMLVYDLFAIYLKVFLLAFASLLIWLSTMTNIPDAEDSGDFYTLLLSSVIGMSMMAGANHLAMVFLAVEMASVPSYALAGFLKGRRQSSEAALKYVVYGGAAAGIMLYGLSLLAGLGGSLHLPTLATNLLQQFAAQKTLTLNTALLLALTLTLVGLAFKLSAVPFHFWCPDVFEGAAAEVGAFLSVASKGAAIALLARFGLTLVGVFHSQSNVADWTPAVAAMSKYFTPSLAVIAAVTATFGNLAAYGQTNLKRLLAYSTIAHAGYMIMALAPLKTEGAQAALFYLFSYFLMNLGAFAVVAFIRNAIGSEDLADYAGLIHRAPVLTVCMGAFLLSLTGLPPLVGFIGKWQIFNVLYQSGFMSLLIVGGINTVISLVYYLNVLRIMVIQGEPTGEKPIERSYQMLFAGVLGVATVWYGLFFAQPLEWSNKSAESLRRQRVTAAADATPTTQTVAVTERANP